MKTVSYRSLGLSNTGEMFQKAFTEKYAVPAYNFNNMEQLQAIMKPENFVGRSPEQTVEFITEYVQPVLDENKDILGMKAEINV